MDTLVPGKDSENRPIAPQGDDAEWDEFVSSCPFGHHEQSSGYGVLRTGHGFKRELVTVRSGGRIVGGAQVLSYPTPIGRTALVLRGPLGRDDDADVLRQVGAELDQFARATRCATMVVETFDPQSAARAAMAELGFAPSDVWRRRSLTAQARVDRGDEEILASMTPKGRYNTRLAERRGVEVRSGGRELIEAFYDLHANTARHQGFPIFRREYFEYLWDLFSPSGRVQLFLATYQDRPVGVIFNTTVGDRMLYGWGGMSRGDVDRKLMANYLLHFRAMCWAREHACKVYDLLEVSSANERGLTRFKTRIAPQKVEWPMAMRKWYGVSGPLRAALANFTWRTPVLQRSLKKIGHKIGLRKNIPW